MELPSAIQKATLFELTEADLNRLLPEFKSSGKTFHFEINLWKKRFLEDLEKQGKTIRRGDIISMPIYRDDQNPDDTEKWIFDGEKVRELEINFNFGMLPSILDGGKRTKPQNIGKGLIPPTFEVLTEFPINYWTGLVDSNFVPYSFSDNHPEAEAEDVKILKEKGTAYFYFPFTNKGKDCKLIADFSTKVQREDPLNAEDFFEKLEEVEYYRINPKYEKPEQLGPQANHLYLPI